MTIHGAHPIAVAMATGDTNSAIQALSADVTLSSPILVHPYEGKETVAAVLETLAETFTDATVLADFGANDRHVVTFEARLGNRQTEVTQLMRLNDAGGVVEIRVFIRPLPALVAAMAVLVTRLARRQSRLRGVTAAVLTRPFSALAPMYEGALSRLIRRRDRP